MASKKLFSMVVCGFLLVSSCPDLRAAPKPDLWPRWQAHNPESTTTVDHGAWKDFLAKYLVTDDPSGVNLVRYGGVRPEDRQGLEEYLAGLESVQVSNLSQAEQLAYWINFYNALTVKVVLDHYPVQSIKDIDISPGWFSDGPWDAKLLEVEGEKVSLNDIEHRILRPIWRDNRVHYAVNCASIGCPNLQPVAFTAGNTEGLLEKGAREYINHPRGARFEGRTLFASSIYDWFQVDFDGSKEGVVNHLLEYAHGPVAASLRGFDGKVRYHYDWSLNDGSR